MSDLLPPNATPLEAKLASLVAEILDIRPLGAEMLDPSAVPPDFMSLLADELRVDVWDSTWRDATKRAVLASAVSVHRKRGTLGAVRRAIRAVGIEPVITEWFEQTPPAPPHTFALGVRLNDNVDRFNPFAKVTDKRLGQAVQAVEGAKRASQHFTIGLSSDHDAGVETAALVRTTVKINGTGEAAVMVRPGVTLGIACIVIPQQIIRIKRAING